jgi:hypothetical protein
LDCLGLARWFGVAGWSSPGPFPTSHHFGPLRRILGRDPARVNAQDAESRIGADETISVWVPIGQPTPLSNVWVVACLRGSDLGTAEAQLRAMLASAVLRN